MSTKLPCEIIKIALDDASYKETSTEVFPTYINYFFGNNGTGKSTLANAIRNGVGISYAHGRSASNYIIHVFDQKFIDDNMRLYHNLPGVFTINEINVDIQKQLDKNSEAQAAASRRFADAAVKKDEKTNEKDNLLDKMYKECWKKAGELRSAFEKTQDGKKKAKLFTEAVKAHSATEHNVDEMKRMYESVYSASAKTYPRFSELDNPAVLDSLAGREILGQAIVNTSNTPFADFLKKVGSIQWVRQGHDEYHAAAKGCCPYCMQELPSDFEEKLSASFDHQYNESLEKLNEFLATYRSSANQLFVSLSKLPTEIYPSVDVASYNGKLTVIKAAIQSNIDKIREKVESPELVVTLEKTAPLFLELSTMIQEYNKLIDANNELVAAGPKKKKDCTKAVFEHIAFILKDVLDGYARSEKVFDQELTKQQRIMDEQQATLKKLQAEYRALSSKTVETKTAMNAINMILRDTGFQGFAVRPHKEVNKAAINYEVIRTDTGEIAKNLSEGEKNFIAFLYFQQMVFGSATADGEHKDKIVVIDDPVSSMDSKALFVVGALVRKMIEICRNNADNRNALVAGNFIKQIFILTHNAYFHREVSYPHVKRYRFVSFYLIQKRDGKSFIRLCECQNPSCPSEQMNVNPVKNSYAALWEEYKEVSSPIPLMNIIRRILEYYFLQLCGYEGESLRKRILEDHKEDFICHNDYTKFDMASSMLSYISSTEHGINDDMHYVDDCSDTDICRDTFRMIFQHMGQEQHFEMMTDIG